MLIYQLEKKKESKYMRIGIDIDNCISNFDDTLLKEYLKHDKELRNKGIINESPEYLRKGMFDWTEDEEKNFYNANIENFAKKLKPIEDSSYYIKKLKEDGHEIYIITGRDNGEYTNPHELTKEWLNKYDIEVDRIDKEKPPALIYVDDRAICFDGNTQHLWDSIISFKTWQENKSIKISSIVTMDDECTYKNVEVKNIS